MVEGERGRLSSARIVVFKGRPVLRSCALPLSKVDSSDCGLVDEVGGVAMRCQNLLRGVVAITGRGLDFV